MYNRISPRKRRRPSHVLSKLARAWGGVRPHRGITVIPTCGAVPAPVMPQVRRTWGRAESRENPQVQRAINPDRLSALARLMRTVCPANPDRLSALAGLTG